MANFLKKITDANFLPGKRARGNNHYVYSSIFNSLMDKLIPIITGEKEVTVGKLKYEDIGAFTLAGGAVSITARSGKITTGSLTTAANGIYDFRAFFVDIEGNSISLSDDAMLFAVVKSYSGVGIPIVQRVEKSAGNNWFLIQILNAHASSALNNVVELNYFIINT